jgi:hypothetical protein
MRGYTSVVIWVMVLAAILGGLYFWRDKMVQSPMQWVRQGVDTQLEPLTEVEGSIENIFAEAQTLVVEDQNGVEWGIAVDRFTQFYNEEGVLIGTGELSPSLRTGSHILAIIQMDEGRTGTALLIRILSP